MACSANVYRWIRQFCDCLKTECRRREETARERCQRSWSPRARSGQANVFGTCTTNSLNSRRVWYAGQFALMSITKTMKLGILVTTDGLWIFSLVISLRWHMRILVRNIKQVCIYHLKHASTCIHFILAHKHTALSTKLDHSTAWKIPNICARSEKRLGVLCRMAALTRPHDRQLQALVAFTSSSYNISGHSFQGGLGLELWKRGKGGGVAWTDPLSCAHYCITYVILYSQNVVTCAAYPIESWLEDYHINMILRWFDHILQNPALANDKRISQSARPKQTRHATLSVAHSQIKLHFGWLWLYPSQRGLSTRANMHRI